MILSACTNLLFALVLFSTRVLAQDPGGGETEKPGEKVPPLLKNSDNTSSDFIEPYTVDEAVDKFVYGEDEFLFVNKLEIYEAAIRECSKTYSARLAFIQDTKVANFLAEALSETQLILDSLWIGGQRLPNTTEEENKWVWKVPQKDFEEDISEEIKGLFETSKEVAATDRDCLAFGRSDHDKPQFRPLVCKAFRALMCQRPRGGGPDGGSTHPGWIRLGDRLYKIFVAQYNYTEAQQACAEFDIDAQLAVITSFKDSQYLGRYLLIGRPSLENAWIGGEYQDDGYIFPAENIKLANETVDGYPPWRNDKIQKARGCLLLDRHVANLTLFIEARCQRYRSYICYKDATNETDNPHVDIIIDTFGYRLHLYKRNWHDASQVCLVRYANYGAKLPEIGTTKEISNLLYVMGENKTAVQHIWLGAKYSYNASESPEWRWESDGNVITDEKRDEYNFIKNGTYNEAVESVNNCLNMDRENHLVAMLYGTNCRAHQFFVCSMSDANMRKLIEDEMANATIS